MPKGIPPDATKFKPGQSGNLKGRPRKIPALDQLLADVLGEEDAGTTVAKKILIALSKKAMKGDVRAAEVLLDRCYGRAKLNVGIDHMLTVQGPQFDYTAMSDEDLNKVTQIVNKYQQ